MRGGPGRPVWQSATSKRSLWTTRGADEGLTGGIHDASSAGRRSAGRRAHRRTARSSGELGAGSVPGPDYGTRLPQGASQPHGSALGRSWLSSRLTLLPGKFRLASDQRNPVDSGSPRSANLRSSCPSAGQTSIRGAYRPDRCLRPDESARLIRDTAARKPAVARSRIDHRMGVRARAAGASARHVVKRVEGRWGRGVQEGPPAGPWMTPGPGSSGS